ncbi:MAG: exodeoxyribonuclease VII large subunit [Proteobacteria bacterium]|nr:exodeoxyribonuclease VII large subunit [Pseudomonadota bacterium]MBU4295180.1 exodeoxyribonuclease VII large subunit [Pseudomonadota bacterium]MCG2749038.1 exodeoxyribonuclease VII large subunit [Desulfobulbaceae bacterium]
MSLSPYAARVQTVTELTRSIRGLLETEFSFVTVSGEISNLKRPYSGHCYFTLKDREAQIKVVLFKGQQRYLDTPLQDGRQVICRGRISVYEPRGEYQIIADFVESYGTGALQIAFDNLKKKLADEGLFDSEQKKPLPFLPEKIFLVTSPRGAALFDFLRLARSRFPSVPIEISPVRVQGDGAAEEISRAIKTINSRATEGVIVLCRGGGSIEDLWAFNEEKTAWAIFESRLPVVSAVGHEVDFTIADFVADHRSPTPTAAARDVLPDRETLRQRLSAISGRLISCTTTQLEMLRRQVRYEQQRLGDPTAMLNHFRLVIDHSQLAMTGAMAAAIHHHQEKLNRLEGRLAMQNPARQLVLRRRLVDELGEKIVVFTRMQMERKRQEFAKAAVLLDAVSPLAVLGRGYAIVSRDRDGRVIRSANQTGPGELLRIRLHEGSLISEVKEREG